MFSSVNRATVVSDLSPARRWHIVLARDLRFDGAFVYAVRSTGIYCRPTCPSRRPRRELVTFFPIPEAAEQAGFRPCRRCRPTSVNGAHPDVALVRETCRRLDSHPDEPASLAALSADAGTSPSRLLRAFRAVLGVTPRQYRDARRLERFRRQLHERKRVSPATYAAGYGSSSRVYERAGAHLGMTPATYARGGRGARIAFTAVPCPHGSPRATRAVARACATNPAAIVIPCHRVVRKDGHVGGYRRGVERKQALLRREAGRAKG